MIPVYCISGLGADERVFSKLELSGCHLHFIKWILPNKNEKIENYALRLSEQVNHPQPVLIGVSFGGMMAVEIAKIIPCSKIFLISSIKTADELPGWIKLCAALKLNKLIPFKRKGDLFNPVEFYFLGPETPNEKDLMKEFRNNTDEKYVYWAIDKILHWKNKTIPSNLIHLLGDRDKFFSTKNSRPDYIIRTGTHFMVYNRAAEVSAIIQKHL